MGSSGPTEGGWRLGTVEAQLLYVRSTWGRWVRAFPRVGVPPLTISKYRVVVAVLWRQVLDGFINPLSRIIRAMSDCSDP